MSFKIKVPKEPLGKKITMKSFIKHSNATICNELIGS